MPRIATALAALALLASAGFCQDDSATPTESVSLFNGKDLSGWIGRADLWSVEDGQIVGRTVAEKPLQQNTFLIYTGSEPSDFELTFQFKIENTNSGVQYRSKILDKENFVVGGYQADIDFSNRYAGILYEEKGRGILAERGQSVTIDEQGKKTRKTFADGSKLGNGIHPGQWNEYRIVAKGNHLQHFINETMTAEVIDNQSEKSSSAGVIAFQLHRGDPMVVRFKNIVLHPAK
ncbi:hypothetical protein Mal15_05260 [Stieleria maiorica]|uniref:3-keto-alpha-glucoside-1,2-lyase/3-keto-2-hydroxy-glucal hydratase domain-containing protein n=1 Tax=Stieleria maiorica TaxID=2795974 RepID=A0A5B9M5R5_9BACT|nr:DUF1080 domain-containing protein [Stieleria maiorica]QEF96498.1 hypothetical protein Mal15_05260 [Stieleria maiorica]